MYGLLKDIILFCQNNFTLIIANIWAFLVFALIIGFLTFFIYSKLYGSKNKKLEAAIKQVQDDNEKLRTNNEELKAELDQYIAHRIIEKKKQNTNNDFTDQLVKDFSDENSK